jgi:hypothetical protein
MQDIKHGEALVLTKLVRRHALEILCLRVLVDRFLLLELQIGDVCSLLQSCEICMLEREFSDVHPCFGGLLLWAPDLNLSIQTVQSLEELSLVQLDCLFIQPVLERLALDRVGAIQKEPKCRQHKVGVMLDHAFSATKTLHGSVSVAS